MKRKSIYLAIGPISLILLGFIFSLKATIIAAVVLPAACFLLKLKNRKTSIQKSVRPTKIEDIIDIYGNPDDIILVNPIHGNEPDGIIMIYNKKGLFIICGIPVNKNDIIDVTFNNASMAYIQNDYQIVFTTKSENNPYLFIHVGNDALYAKEVLMQIKQHLDYE